MTIFILFWKKGLARILIPVEEKERNMLELQGYTKLRVVLSFR